MTTVHKFEEFKSSCLGVSNDLLSIVRNPSCILMQNDINF